MSQGYGRSERGVAHFDESGKNGSADAIEFTALAAATTFGELDAMGVQCARELRYERSVKHVCAWACGGGHAVQHARKGVSLFEDGASPEWIVGLVG